MRSKSLLAAIVAALSVAVGVVVARRLSAGGVDPVADAPPRVTDFSH
ncbi:MAG: hypothetical protein QM728_14760 [Gordonia sp. (in: high G+C Gram-positive bacteria)]